MNKNNFKLADKAKEIKVKKGLLTYIIYIVSVLLIFTVIFSNMNIYAETAQQKKKRIEKELENEKAKKQTIQSEITRSLKSIVELEGQIAEKEEEIEKLQKESKETKEEAEKMKKELLLLEEECKKKEEIAKKRLTYMYEFGEYKTWEILLKSDGILDFFSNYYMLKEIAKIDHQILKDASRDKKRVETLKTELESKKKIIDESEERVKKSKVVQENLRVLKEDNVKSLNKKEKLILANISDLQRQEKEAEAQIAREAAKYNGSSMSLAHPDGKYIWPLPMSSNYMTTNYGDGPAQGYYWTSNPRGHLGLDIADSTGTPIYAVTSGIVALAQRNGGYGNCVVIDHGAGIFTLYGHGNSINVYQGQRVERGQQIMTMGNTGMSTGSHLHFEFMVGGWSPHNRVNPLHYVQRPVPLLYRPGISSLSRDIY